MDISHSVLTYKAVAATDTRPAKPARSVDAYTAFCDSADELAVAQTFAWVQAFKTPGADQTFGVRMSAPKEGDAEATA